MGKYLNMKTIEIYGTLYLTVTADEAQELPDEGHEIYLLKEDGSLDDINLESILYENVEYVVKIGEIEELRSEYEEGQQNRFRNNVRMSFEDFIDQKVEMCLI